MQSSNMVRFAWFVIFLIQVGVVFSEEAVSPERPNFVVIYADDLGYGDIQCYNPERGKILTPHVDRLASEGMRFTDGHSSSGCCSPSRYTLLTGRYHWRSKLQNGIVKLWEEALIKPDRMTIASLAKKQGYRTACIGKWHLGWDWQILEDQKKFFSSPPKRQKVTATEAQRAAWMDVFSKPIHGGPMELGFDRYFGTDVPNWPPFCYIEQNRTLGIPSEFLPQSLMVKNQVSKQGPALKGWTLEPVLPALGEKSEKFIRSMESESAPFLLYLSLTSPHTPLSVNEEWKGKSGLNLYADFVMETDSIVGQVMAALKKSGQDKNTMVIFTSDNGCAKYIGTGELEKKGHYPSGPLRGYKGDVWEGGHRVPFVVRWPEVVKSASECYQLVHQADLMATFAEVMGAEIPKNAGEDSFSFLPLLKGDDEPVRHHAVSCAARGVPGVRLNQWKYILEPVRGGDPMVGQLFDLANDLGETQNLAEKEPERVKEMEALFERLIVRGRSTLGPRQNNDVRVRRYLSESEKK